jgi:hypothetical protein
LRAFERAFPWCGGGVWLCDVDDRRRSVCRASNSQSFPHSCSQSALSLLYTQQTERVCSARSSRVSDEWAARSVARGCMVHIRAGCVHGGCVHGHSFVAVAVDVAMTMQEYVVVVCVCVCASTCALWPCVHVATTRLFPPLAKQYAAAGAMGERERGARMRGAP